MPPIELPNIGENVDKGADAQKTVTDVTNIITQLNAVEARLADLITKQQTVEIQS